MTIPVDLKAKALIHYEHFEPSLRKVAQIYNISKSALSKWLKRGCIAKTCKQGKRVGHRFHKSSKTWSIMQMVSGIISLDPFVRAVDIQKLLCEKVTVSLSTIYRAIRRNGYTFKQSQRCPQGPPPQSHSFMRLDAPYTNAVSVDECHFHTRDKRRWGWGIKGKRVPKSPECGRKSLSLILAIDHTGIVSSAFHVGSVNSEKFCQFLKTLPRGRPVVLDNAAIHRSHRAAQTATEQNIKLRFIPPYSPWFNPVEFAFSELKQSTRRSCGSTMRLNGLEELVKAGLKRGVAAPEYFAHCERLYSELSTPL